MRIGFTEAGDAALDMRWADALEHGDVDGAIVITKNLNDRLRKKLLALHEHGRRVIVHTTVTGWGGTWLEPNVPTPERQLRNLAQLIRAGFPSTHCVLRIDPIIPTPEGLARVEHVIRLARVTDISTTRDGAILMRDLVSDMSDLFAETQSLRMRISVLDEYRHAKQRIRDAGYDPFYGPNRFQPTDDELKHVIAMLERVLPHHDARGPHTVECCAETRFVQLANARADIADANVRLVARGCLSELDLKTLGLDPHDAPSSVNGQNRRGCLCLTAKTELLSRKSQCPHKCLYCYWR